MDNPEPNCKHDQNVGLDNSVFSNVWYGNMASRLLPVGQITVQMLRSLIDLEIAEGQAIEFKRVINIADHSAKKKLSAEAASFANASGGDIVFGMDEQAGKASGLVALPNFDADKIELQVRQIFNSHIDPPLPGLSFCPVAIAPGEFALVLRIPRSWTRPHALLGDPLQFFVRDGNRRRGFTVRELREAFGLSASIADRMKKFRADRIASLLSDAACPLSSRPFVVLHIMPQGAFDSAQSVDLALVMNRPGLIWPMRDAGFSTKLNFDGVLAYFPGDHLAQEAKSVRSYVQVFRDGCVEIVTTEIFHDLEHGKIIFPAYEESIELAVRRHLIMLEAARVEPPFFVALTVIGAEDYSLAVRDQFGFERVSAPIGREIVIVPETPIYTYASTYHDGLKEPFDRIWQTCGQSGSINYSSGKWSPAWKL
jgi:hypothetical protein